MKLKKVLSIVLAVMLIVSCMSFTAFADGGTITVTSGLKEWSTAGTYVVNEDVTIDGGVTVTGNVTLTIAEGATLTIIGKNGTDSNSFDAPDGTSGADGITITSGTLTVNGAGTLNITGGNGGNGGMAEHGAGIGGSGGSGINGGSVTISGGSVISTGGSGGSGGLNEGGSNLGNGGSGGSGVTACSLTVSGGSVNAAGGNGGKGGDASYSGPGSGGNGGNGIDGGSVTINNGSVNAAGGDGGKGGTGDYDNGSDGSDGSDINDATVIMADGEISSNGSRTFASGTSFSGGRTNFEVDAEYLASGCECISDESVTGYTYRIEAPAYTITNNKSDTDKDDNNGYLTVSAESAEAGTEVTVTAVPNEGYALSAWDVYKTDDSTTKVTVTDGKFTMPAYAVTVGATFVQTSKEAGDDFDLDLDDDTTDIPVNTTVDQYYMKTTGESTVYNHRIGIEWSSEVMNIKVVDAKEWNPNTLSWDVDNDYDGNGVATVEDDTNKKTVTLTNYSAKAFTCSLTFTADDSVAGKYTSYSVEGNDAALAAVTNDINQLGTSVHKGDLPSATITATITPTLTGEGSFEGAEATTENTKYGTFTITCTVADN